MTKLSIGVRLMLWYLAIFALGQFLLGASMWFILRDNLYDLVDDQIESQVEDLKTFLQTQPKGASIGKLREELAETYAHEHSGDLLLVSADSGEVLYQSSFLQAHPSILVSPDRVEGIQTRSRRVDGREFRFVFEKLVVNDHAYTIEMGAPAEDAVDTLRMFRSSLLMFAPLLLLAAAGVGYWMSRRALAPVDRLVGAARQIGGSNLNRRLEQLQTGDELQRLSDTLNEMLERIESAFLRVTQFTADASHELRTPVSLIRTEAELALRRSRGEAEYKEALRHILEEAERTTLLIEQLLELARADSGRGVLDLQTIDLKSIVERVAENWQQVASVRNLQFSANICEEHASVLGDENLLHRLTDILLDNALKYTPPPGFVRLTLERTEEEAVITVQDSGVGIAPEEQQKIFERFYRVDKARSRSQGGTGLGLAIAHWIVSQHHGSIRVESHPGQGATFRVKLPAVGTLERTPLPA